MGDGVEGGFCGWWDFRYDVLVSSGRIYLPEGAVCIGVFFRIMIVLLLCGC